MLLFKPEIKDKWKKIIHRTEIQLLKALKIHHRERSSQLQLERSLRGGADNTTAEEAVSTIDRAIQDVEELLRRRKTRKLNRLLQQKPPKPNRHPRPVDRPQPATSSSPTPRTVINLAEAELSTTELSLLSKGLKFAPQPPRINRYQLKQDLAAFGRRMRPKELFYDPDVDSEEEYGPEERRFKEKSRWNPPKNRDPALEAYLKALEADAWHLTSSTNRADNLTPSERQALTKLHSRTDIVIKPADKGSATVVMSREAYMAEAYRQLNDSRYYRKLDEEPTEKFANEVKDLILEMANAGHINEDTKKYLTPSESRTAWFYHLPKIHRPDVPSRPIVSSCGAPTERILEFVDYHLRPLVVATSSYLKDTTDFLMKLETLGELPPGCILMTLDEKSLYTNTPHDEGIEACRKALERRPHGPPTAYLTRMMEQILTLNNFSFNGEHYLQLNGTAIGTRMAPSYANLFMARGKATELDSCKTLRMVEVHR